MCIYLSLPHKKNRGPGPYNSLRHTDNRKCFSGLSLTRNRGEALFYLAWEVERIWRCYCCEKGKFIMIIEFKYRQTWKIWPSPLSLALSSTSKIQMILDLMKFKTTVDSKTIEATFTFPEFVTKCKQSVYSIC